MAFSFPASGLVVSGGPDLGCAAARDASSKPQDIGRSIFI